MCFNSQAHALHRDGRGQTSIQFTGLYMILGKQAGRIYFSGLESFSRYINSILWNCSFTWVIFAIGLDSKIPLKLTKWFLFNETTTNHKITINISWALTPLQATYIRITSTSAHKTLSFRYHFAAKEREGFLPNRKAESLDSIPGRRTCKPQALVSHCGAVRLQWVTAFGSYLKTTS